VLVVPHARPDDPDVRVPVEVAHELPQRAGTQQRVRVQQGDVPPASAHERLVDRGAERDAARAREQARAGGVACEQVAEALAGAVLEHPQLDLEPARARGPGLQAALEVRARPVVDDRHRQVGPVGLGRAGPRDRHRERRRRRQGRRRAALGGSDRRAHSVLLPPPHRSTSS
jgi:hypothetical protein